MLGDALRLGLVAHVVEADARDPLAFLEQCGSRFDVTVSCVKCAGAEQAAVLATRPEGTICFFGMSTSFTSAAPTAEGVGRQVNMLIGNGYRPGHADLALSLVRGIPGLMDLLTASIRDPSA
ncbi:hypothetical protein [Urbifossiella limnaea]|uniref:L-erythro-3,5-diaminohexanoate dehydrogenase n=1 Tax=Urbifossiella limnaea TaxID=2528023 RepID=A0A517XWC5_9BACT|nr:hypothetical protein [Urbifossiella limnaea]QDU21774.1 L-erythro-3,5-diaminohexanoate dehydrogenase [Urbifossiella limnaea]